MNCLVCGRPALPLYRRLFDDRYGAPGRHTVYRCTRCGFGRIYPGLSARKIGTFYAKYYPLAVATPASVLANASVPPRWKAWLSGTDNTAHWHVAPGAKVLDVGSASGVSLLETQQLGGEPFGVEPDPHAGRLAKQLGLRVFVGFLEDDPFPGELFDIICASQVLEHTPDPRKFLRAVQRRLAPDGYAILSFPNFDAPFRKLWGHRWLHWHIPYHYNFFTRQSFKELANSAGLRVKKIRTITPNLWAILQLRSTFVEPAEGVMNPIWAPQHRSPVASRRPSLFIRGVRRLSLLGASVLVAVINRVVDSLGLGESFLVWVERESP